MSSTHPRLLDDPNLHRLLRMVLTHRRWLVLGVTAQSITTLHTMEPQEEPSSARGEGFDTSARTAMGFAQLLGKLRQHRGDDGR